MADKFARERMVQIFKDDANIKPSTVVRINFFCFVLLSVTKRILRQQQIEWVCSFQASSSKCSKLGTSSKVFFCCKKSNKN